MPAHDVVALAVQLVNGGCRRETALWISFKFAAQQEHVPTVKFMSYIVGCTEEYIIKSESEDLIRINWDIAPFAKRCNLL
jgi:hypothetical protein